MKYVSDGLKWCEYCQITYKGCRYCLTTNIIFGITDQSLCRKCKRITSITIETPPTSSDASFKGSDR